jgi:Heavy-metal-associated domain
MDTRDEESEITYIVPGLGSDQSESAVSRRLLTSPRVQAVVIDLGTKGVTVHGRGLDAPSLRALIESTGYQAG